jgi:curved DNA-binding protein CbpA
MDVEKHRFTDFFDILEVDRTATKEDVQKAFMLKASVWHPDKAETDADREHYTKVYQDLQVAYKILSNDHSRKQYIDAQQTTDLEFKFADRDVGYVHTDQFRTQDGKFDTNAFVHAFDESRDAKEIEAMQRLRQSRDDTVRPVSDDDFKSLLGRRNAELQTLQSETHQIFDGTGTGKDFDANTFNYAFDFMKEHNPGKGVQLYEGNPMGMFSGGGLEECDPMSGIQMRNGTDFTGQDMDNLIQGQSVNPGSDFNISAFRSKEKYGREQKLTEEEIQNRMAAIQTDRINLATMDKSNYISEPTEIELLYSDLFQPMNIEGLEAPIPAANGNLDAALDAAESTKVQIPKDSSKIRRKIEQKKHVVSKIEKKTAGGV